MTRTFLSVARRPAADAIPTEIPERGGLLTGTANDFTMTYAFPQPQEAPEVFRP
jgi:hypothetical protein